MIIKRDDMLFMNDYNLKNVVLCGTHCTVQLDESFDNKVPSPCLTWKLLVIIQSLICCHDSVSTCIHRLFFTDAFDSSPGLARVYAVCFEKVERAGFSKQTTHCSCIDSADERPFDFLKWRCCVGFFQPGELMAYLRWCNGLGLERSRRLPEKMKDSCVKSG